MNQVFDTDPASMSLEEIEEEYDSYPATFEDMDEYKKVSKRKRALAENYNSRQGEHRARVGVSTRRVF